MSKGGRREETIGAKGKRIVGPFSKYESTNRRQNTADNRQQTTESARVGKEGGLFKQNDKESWAQSRNTESHM